MIEKKKVTIHDAEYTMRKANLARIAQVGELLGIDVIADGIGAVKWNAIGKDVQKVRALLDAILENSDGLDAEMTYTEVYFLVMGFCMEGKRAEMRLNNDVDSLIVSMNQAAQSLPAASPSMSQSIPVVGETLS